MLLPFHDDQPTTRWPIFTVLIIALNVLTFVGVNNLTTEEQNLVHIHYGFVPARLAQLGGDPAAVDVVYAEETAVGLDGRPRKIRRVETLESDSLAVVVSLITAMFLHGGIAHLLGNMWFFWIYGNNIEDRLGHFVFILYYLIGGIVATLSHAMWVQFTAGADVPLIGASGAVAAVLGGYAVTFPWARIRTLVIFFIITIVELPALVVLGFWLLGELVMGLMQIGATDVAGVAYWAHIGGFVFGLAVMPLLNRVIPPITPEYHANEDDGYYRGEPDPGDPFGGAPTRPGPWQSQPGPPPRRFDGWPTQ